MTLMKKELKGSFTIEMTVIMSVILMIFTVIVLTIFCYHDKNIISAAVYETAVVASNKLREGDDITESDIADILKERVGDKCILLKYESQSIIIEEESISVEASASKGKYKVRSTVMVAVTIPEDYIREQKRWKDLLQ